MRVAKRKSSRSWTFLSCTRSLVNYLLCGLGLVEFALDAGQERLSLRGRRYAALKQLAIIVFAAIIGPDGLIIGTDIHPTQVHTNKGSLGARIGQDARVQLPIGTGCDLAAKRAGGDSGIGSDLPVGGE